MCCIVFVDYFKRMFFNAIIFVVVELWQVNANEGKLYQSYLVISVTIYYFGPKYDILPSKITNNWMTALIGWSRHVTGSDTLTLAGVSKLDTWVFFCLCKSQGFINNTMSDANDIQLDQLQSDSVYLPICFDFIENI